MLTKQTIFQASIILTITILLSHAIGFLREIAIANSFGTSKTYDVYLVAVTFPLVVCSLVLFAIPSVFIPIYMKEKVQTSEASAWVFAWNFVTTFGIFFFCISLILYALAPLIIKGYAPSLSAEEVSEAVAILRIVSIVVFFNGVFAVLKSIFNAERHFLLPAIAPLFLNIMMIGSIFFLSGSIATRALAIGLVLGYLFQVVILAGFFLKKQPMPKFFLNFHDKLLKKALGALFLVLIIESIGQMNVVVDRFFVSILPTGSISALNYASTLYQIAIGAFGISVGTAIFPSVAEYVAGERWDSLVQLYSKGIRSVLVVTIPFAFLTIVFAEEIVTLVFQRGAFGRQATFLTARALQCYSIGLVAFVSHAILIKVYYAMHKELALLLSTLTAFTLKILLSLWLVQEYRHQGLALATSLAGILNIAILSIYLRSKIGRIDGKRILITLAKVSIISALSVSMARWIMNYMSTADLIARACVAFIVGGLAFLFLARLFKVEEISQLLCRMRL